jgi:hypothetical protein
MPHVLSYLETLRAAISATTLWFAWCLLSWPALQLLDDDSFALQFANGIVSLAFPVLASFMRNRMPTLTRYELRKVGLPRYAHPLGVAKGLLSVVVMLFLAIEMSGALAGFGIGAQGLDFSDVFGACAPLRAAILVVTALLLGAWFAARLRYDSWWSVALAAAAAPIACILSLALVPLAALQIPEVEEMMSSLSPAREALFALELAASSAFGALIGRCVRPEIGVLAMLHGLARRDRETLIELCKQSRGA